MATFKIALLGESGVGKTTFLNRFITGEFIRNHEFTANLEVHPVCLNTTVGEIVLNVWDFDGLHNDKQQYLNDADAAIIMCDYNTIDTVQYWSFPPVETPTIQ